MYGTIVNVAKELVNKLNEIVKVDNEVEIRDLLGRFTTDIIGTCAFGIECNSLKDPETKFRKMAKIAVDEPSFTFPTRILMATFPKILKLLRIKRNRDEVTDFFMNIVRETIEYRAKNAIRRNDFMDSLIDLKKSGLTFNEIVAQAFIFFIAGFETSSTTITHCLHELSLNKHKHIQEKARKEVLSVFEKYNGELTYESLNELVYCEQIINGKYVYFPFFECHFLLIIFSPHRNTQKASTDCDLS